MDKVTAPAMQNQRGISLIEVLVTMIILAIGLLGLVALQSRVQVLQAESYQRAQALILLKDMSSRIANNRQNAVAYVTGAGNPLGGTANCPGTGATRQTNDSAQWCAALKGAGETLGGSYVGAMVGGRGCVENLGGGQFLVTVAWQGLAPISAPPVSVACGLNLYNGAGTSCVDDLCRRTVTTIVHIADLT
jgi:type IV pilus assembly protein PilV